MFLYQDKSFSAWHLRNVCLWTLGTGTIPFNEKTVKIVRKLVNQKSITFYLAGLLELVNSVSMGKPKVYSSETFPVHMHIHTT